FPEIFFLIRLRSSTRIQLFYPTIVSVTPFGRCQVPPAQTASDEIAAVIPYDAQIGVVRIDDPTVSRPNEDSYDIGVDHPPDLRFQPIGPFTQRCFHPFARGDF